MSDFRAWDPILHTILGGVLVFFFQLGCKVPKDRVIANGIY